jgi:undecaprenyl diphosphate synthase
MRRDEEGDGALAGRGLPVLDDATGRAERGRRDAVVGRLHGRIPRHVGLIPDGNRRWARGRGLPAEGGYAAGIAPGLRILERCGALGIEEVSIYGFTKENVHRPGSQVDAFRRTCAEFGLLAVEHGAALLVVGDTGSAVFPESLRPFAERRSAGSLRVNLLVNYGWQWDLGKALGALTKGGRGIRSRVKALGSAAVSSIDLVVRWGGRQRLSGFLPLQCAHADVCVIETLWPDARPEELGKALAWYQRQDVTRGG